MLRTRSKIPIFPLFFRITSQYGLVYLSPTRPPGVMCKHLESCQILRAHMGDPGDTVFTFFDNPKAVLERCNDKPNRQAPQPHPQPNSSTSTKFKHFNQIQAPLIIPPPHLDNRNIHHKPHRSQGHMVHSLCAGSLKKQACRSECYERADGPCTLCGDASHNVRTGCHVYFDQTWQPMLPQVVNRHSTEQHTCG